MTITGGAAGVRAVWPLLFVQDLEPSIRFFRDRLGFTVVGQADDDGTVYWCRLERGAASIMLQQADAEDGPAEGRGRGVGLFFVCDDVDDLYGEFIRRGLALAPPALADYGMKQVFVPEPNGYHVCFESPVAA